MTHRFATIMTVLLAPLFLHGCVSANANPQPAAVDTFCLTAKKRPWSIEDTAESIRHAEIWNRTVDRRCGIPSGPKGTRA